MREVVEKNNIEAIKKWLGNGSINIFGLPFSGKDTHGHILAKLLGGEVIGGGDILRSEHGPQHIKDHIATGALAPTDEFLEIVLPYLSKDKYKNKPLILSTVGRWHGEESSVLRAAEESGHPIKAVVFLHIPKQEVIRRHGLSQSLEDRGQRHDDHERSLQKRFEEFEQKTLPVIEHYRQAGLLLEIDGSPPISEVSDKITEQLAYKASARS